jgi:hypothetical protein
MSHTRYELDADLPGYWEARLIGNSAIGKALWLLLFPIFQVTRPPRLKEIRMFDRWIVLNFAVQIAFDAAIYVFLGPKAFVYLAASFFFSVGLHPLGARWIQEHYDVWMRRKYPQLPLERYADGAIVHCRTEAEAREVRAALAARMEECRLELHPEKTKVVYRKDDDRRGSMAGAV